MEHTGAIANYLIPMLLALLCGIASYGLHMHQRFMARMDRETEHFRIVDNDHESRVTRCETRIDHVEADILRLDAHAHGGRP